jgi:predicted metal-binding membrane protein
MVAGVTPGTRDRTRLLLGLALLATVAWLVIGAWARSMEPMPGTMGLNLVAFIGMWSLMMAAMMLPSSMPLITLYGRTIQTNRARHLALFGAGYLTAWAATAIPVFGLAWAADELTADHPRWATGAAMATFAIAGVYQLTPLKERCLHHCRSPLSHLFHYSSYRGRLRDLRAGLHHGLFCLGCCWALMVLMVTFGVMNLWAMVALAGIIALEKQWSRGRELARVIGVLCLILAVTVPFAPGLAPGFDASGDSMPMESMDGM